MCICLCVCVYLCVCVCVSVCVCVFVVQRPSLMTVAEWIDYETLALLFGMVSV